MRVEKKSNVGPTFQNPHPVPIREQWLKGAEFYTVLGLDGGEGPFIITVSAFEVSGS